MSTRCVIDFHQDLVHPPLARVYERFDGQPRRELERIRRALDLYQDLVGKEGTPEDVDMGEIAACYVKANKTSAGGLFLTRDLPWNIDYLYQLYLDARRRVRIRVLVPSARFVWHEQPSAEEMRVIAQGFLPRVMRDLLHGVTG